MTTTKKIRKFNPKFIGDQKKIKQPKIPLHILLNSDRKYRLKADYDDFINDSLFKSFVKENKVTYSLNDVDNFEDYILPRKCYNGYGIIHFWGNTLPDKYKTLFYTERSKYFYLNISLYFSDKQLISLFKLFFSKEITVLNKRYSESENSLKFKILGEGEEDFPTSSSFAAKFNNLLEIGDYILDNNLNLLIFNTTHSSAKTNFDTAQQKQDFIKKFKDKIELLDF